MSRKQSNGPDNSNVFASSAAVGISESLVATVQSLTVDALQRPPHSPGRVLERQNRLSKHDIFGQHRPRGMTDVADHPNGDPIAGHLRDNTEIALVFRIPYEPMEASRLRRSPK